MDVCYLSTYPSLTFDLSESVIEAMVRRWYDESSNYDYASPGWRKDAVHFTQLVWRATTDIGVGVAKMDNPVEDKFVVVVHYYPAGERHHVLDPMLNWSLARIAGTK